MTETATLDAYGVVTEPATLKIERLLPGPVERVWDYLTKSELRRQWLASGNMDLKVDAPFELTWRNDELTDPPGTRPEGFSEQHSMQSRITELEPLRKLTFTWGDCGSVTMTLEPRGTNVLLTLVHQRISDRKNMLMVGAGWHMHLDILAARINGKKALPFWDGWLRLRDEYDQRIAV